MALGSLLVFVLRRSRNIKRRDNRTGALFFCFLLLGLVRGNVRRDLSAVWFFALDFFPGVFLYFCVRTCSSQTSLFFPAAIVTSFPIDAVVLL